MRSNAWAIAAPSLATASPQSFSTSSGPAPVLAVTTGVPHASDSRMLKPNVSNGLGAMVAVALAMISANSALSEIRPRNFTSSPSADAANDDFIGPSPAMRNEMLCPCNCRWRAASITRYGRFSTDNLPAKSTTGDAISGACPAEPRNTMWSTPSRTMCTLCETCEYS